MKEIVPRKHTRKIIKYKEAYEGITCSIKGCHQQKSTYHQITITTFMAMQFNLCESHYKQFQQEATLIFNKTQDKQTVDIEL